MTHGFSKGLRKLITYCVVEVVCGVLASISMSLLTLIVGPRMDH